MRYPAIRGNTSLGFGVYSFPENCRCRVCDKFMKWEGKFCPCCGYPISRKPRAGKSQRALLARKNTKRI